MKIHAGHRLAHKPHICLQRNPVGIMWWTCGTRYDRLMDRFDQIGTGWTPAGAYARWQYMRAVQHEESLYARLGVR